MMVFSFVIDKKDYYFGKVPDWHPLHEFVMNDFIYTLPELIY
jgi:hypothetical protein